MNRTGLFSSLFLSSTLLMGFSANAHVSAISAGTASAGKAAIEPYDVPYQNPAGIAYTRGYHFATGVSRLTTKGDDDQEEFAVLLSDNLDDTVVPTALAYIQRKDLGNGSDFNSRDLKLAVGNYIVGKNAVGFGFAYRQERTTLGQNQGLSMVLGSLFAINKNLGFAVVLENFAPILNSDTLRERLDPQTSLGLSYNFGQFLRMRLDASSERNNSWNRPTFATGLENYWNRWLIFRLGAARDNEYQESIYSVGFGFAGPRLGVHYALQTIERPTSRDQRHSIDLGFPIW